MDSAKSYFKIQTDKAQARRQMMENQSNFFKGATEKNLEWKNFAKMKTNAVVAQVKGTARGKVLRHWANQELRIGTLTKYDFMSIISSVKDGTDPVFHKLSEMLSGLKEYDHFDTLFLYVTEIQEIVNAREANAEGNDNEVQD